MSWSMGASTTQQLLAAGLADELLLHIAPKGPPERAPSRRRLMALATLQEGSLSMRSHSVNTEIGWLFPRLCSKVSRRVTAHWEDRGKKSGDLKMSRVDENKAIVGRWFTDFWGEKCNLGVVDELAAPDMLLQYSLHEPRRGREDIKAFMTDFRKAFPDLNFWGTADLIAEGDYVVGRWEGGGTHTGPAFRDFLAGSLPANTGRTMRFTGMTVLKLKDGKILEEVGLDDGVTALQQLGLIRIAA
jgi:predicted ester cyclase